MQISIDQGCSRLWMRRRFAAQLVLLTSSVLLAETVHADTQRRAFTVADSISMTDLVDPLARWSGYFEPAFKVSPKRDHLAVVTRRGNLGTGYNEYTLLLFSVREIEQLLKTSTQARPHHAQALARFETAALGGGISDLRWTPDGKALAFIGRGTDEVGQVYTVSLATRALLKLTDHPENVASFDLAPGRDRVVYSAYSLPDWTKRNEQGYVVTSEPMDYLATKAPDDSIKQVRYFILNLADGTRKEIQTAYSIEPQRIWLAPNGKWAITLAPVERTLERRMWSDYEDFRASVPAVTAERASPAAQVGTDVFGMTNYRILQFVLFDVDAATSEPILDAPVSLRDGPAREALWSADSSHVVLASTFLPLNVRDPKEDQRRRRYASIVEVDLSSRAAARVSELQGSKAKDRVYVTGVRRLSDDRIAVTRRSRLHAETTVTVYRRRAGGSWSEERNTPPDAFWLLLNVEQDLATAPNIAAEDTRTGRKQLITDLNPQFARLAFGSVSVLEWREGDREVLAGLVLPVGYQQGQRYPLVIQTHGFDRDAFLVDGPDGISTAYAAQALASRGIVVLQLAMDREGFGGPEENPNNARRFERAIDLLDQRGLIDRGRVGLIGFSRTGMHVHHAITFSDIPYAAATIADAISLTPLGYIEHYGRPYPGMLAWERLIGAPFWKDGIRVWLERSPAFHLDRIRTPLRLEHLGTHVSNYWDTFAILKRFRRPVEMVHIPSGTHLLESPRARYTSQEGNVDWFDFWLNGREDSDLAKAPQYLRWRQLREQHGAIEHGESPEPSDGLAP